MIQPYTKAEKKLAAKVAFVVAVLMFAWLIWAVPSKGDVIVDLRDYGVSALPDSIDVWKWEDTTAISLGPGGYSRWRSMYAPDTALICRTGYLTSIVLDIYWPGYVTPFPWPLDIVDLKSTKPATVPFRLFHAWTPLPTDSSIAEFYLDTTLMAYRKDASATAWDFDTTFSAVNGRLNTVILKFYWTGSSAPGIWPWVLNLADTAGAIVTPLQVPGDYVAAYIDIGSGIIDSSSGAMFTRDRTRLTLNLIGAPSLHTTTSIALIPKEWSKGPDANGRVTFYVPANTALLPAGSYYELSYRTVDARSIGQGVMRRFRLDSIPDPVNILNTTEVK